jgi:hypothetical protein
MLNCKLIFLIERIIKHNHIFEINNLRLIQFFVINCNDCFKLVYELLYKIENRLIDNKKLLVSFLQHYVTIFTYLHKVL